MSAEVEMMEVRGRYVVFVDFGDELVVDSIFKEKPEAIRRIEELEYLFTLP
jgi:hypothetical protein